jgi:putative hydrolase of the HAD superfamily
MSARNGDAIRLISFDVGGTLIHAHPSVGAIYAKVLTRRGFRCDAPDVEGAFEASWDAAAGRVPHAAERYRRSPGGERGFWRELLADTVRRLGGCTPPAGAAEELFESFSSAACWKAYPEVFDTLEALERRGVKLAVVSNWDSRLPALLRELGLRRYFGPLLVSALELLEKPDPRIFRLAAARGGVRPGEVLHVGDRQREDVQGAQSAGLVGLRIDRSAPVGEGLDWLDAPSAARQEVHS